MQEEECENRHTSIGDISILVVSVTGILLTMYGNEWEATKMISSQHIFYFMQLQVHVLVKYLLHFLIFLYIHLLLVRKVFLIHCESTVPWDLPSLVNGVS